MRRKITTYTKQRPNSVENSGEDIELKARSQPTGTCLPIRTSPGCDLGPFLTGAGALISRSRLPRSTNCNLGTIPSVLGNDGNEIRTIEASAVATIANRVKARRGGTNSNSARLLIELSGMGETDARDNNATRSCRDNALLDRPYLVSIVSKHAWDSFQAAIS